MLFDNSDLLGRGVLIKPLCSLAGWGLDILFNSGAMLQNVCRENYHNKTDCFGVHQKKKTDCFGNLKFLPAFLSPWEISQYWGVQKETDEMKKELWFSAFFYHRELDICVSTGAWTFSCCCCMQI